jgi:ABC-type branched-subunit amino acid transport system ATPase component/ABC-type branched-subunit amino acid transport system permease subunit
MNYQRLLKGLGIALLIAAPFMQLPSWTLSLATFVFLSAVSLVGLNLIYGLTGMLSLGHAAFAVWPVYVAAVAHQRGLDWTLAIPLGLLAVLVIARVVGAVFIRLPGMYFAIGTLGFTFVTEGLARAFPGISGGASGLVVTLPFELNAPQWYLVSVVALLGALLIYAVITSGSSYRILRMIHSDELSAETLGIDVAKVKVRVFVIGTFFAGVSGLLTAFYAGIVVPEGAGVHASLTALAAVIIGGAGSMFGPIVGPVVVQWLFAAAGNAERYELLIYGVFFLLIVLYAPGGICGLFPGRRPQAHAPVPLQAGQADSQSVFAQRVAPGAPCLQVTNITKAFGGLVAVDSVSLEVRSGEIVALLGPNGAGKSTLFNVVNGIERPDTGAITVLGQATAGRPLHEVASHFGRSFQTPRLSSELTVAENVLVRLDALMKKGSEKNKTATALRQLDEFGLSQLGPQAVHKVGIGLHKLIDVARAAVGSPPLILLDEPAVGLTQKEIDHLAGLLERLRSQGAAVLIVEHNFEFVRRVADRVVVMDRGKVIAVGRAEEVRENPVVQQAYFGALG